MRVSAEIIISNAAVVGVSQMQSNANAPPAERSVLAGDPSRVFHVSLAGLRSLPDPAPHVRPILGAYSPLWLPLMAFCSPFIQRKIILDDDYSPDAAGCGGSADLAAILCRWIWRQNLIALRICADFWGNFTCLMRFRDSGWLVEMSLSWWIGGQVD